MTRKNLKVAVKDLRWICKPGWLPGDRSDQIKPLDKIIGQNRALEAIQTGLGIKSPGYNIYVVGLSGTGKMTTVEKLLKKIDSDFDLPGDICYVYNFDKPTRPIVLYLKAGFGKQLAEDMNKMIREFSQLIPEIEEKEQHKKDFKLLKPNLNYWKNLFKKKYDNKKLQIYFDRMFKHLSENLDDFATKKEKNDAQLKIANLLATNQKTKLQDPFFVYRINVLVDNSDINKPPTVFETAPTYQNLFGTIEHSPDNGGMWDTDFMCIKAGSILQANGGYLIFNFLDGISEKNVWKGLKRALKNNNLRIQNASLPFSFPAKNIKPELVEVNLKLLVIGDHNTYYYLYEHDDEFRKIFKIRAEFDTEMENTRQGIKNYGRFISKVCFDENLLPLDRAAMAVVVEEGLRITGRKKQLSTRFSDIADLVRESHFWAKQKNGKIIHKKHIRQAIKARIKRLQLSEDKLQQLIIDNVLLINLTGEKTGQINGISIYDIGDYSFGKPSRITAEVGLGNAGIINIEREAELGGKIYNKGVLIISGYLTGKYAQSLPLTINASICFEQSYSGIDGDSASAAEIFVLLSSIAQVPIKQNLAVTGSVNQKGEIQAIGGVNQKIEGVYDICKCRGLTGEQGVIIPRQNLQDLMLNEEIVTDVKNGVFNIFAIKTVDEGIELLTGINAGKRNKQGNYPINSFHGMVYEKLLHFSEKMKEFEG